jgi:hypothetical protein
MLWSFFNVAFILFIHGTLYCWREDAVEDVLEEKEKDQEEQRASGNGHAYAGDAGIEMQQRPSGSSARVYVNHPASPSAFDATTPTKAAFGEHAPHRAKADDHSWRVREHPWSEFGLGKWWSGLVLTRKWDAAMMPILAIIYSVGVAVILGRPVSSVAIYQEL